MPTPSGTKIQIDQIVRYMTDTDLSDAQNFPCLDYRNRPLVGVSFPGAEHIPNAMDDRPYEEIYGDLVRLRVFNVKMLDGALIQMTYQFNQRTLVKHRLAFFPSPYLGDFESDPQTYYDDELYADIVANNIVHVPIRFDYDARDDLHKILTHPKSHLTLGQYKNCRIPVTSPLTPLQFIDFILRNFYYTAHVEHSGRLPNVNAKFPTSISPAERGVVHIAAPQ